MEITQRDLLTFNGMKITGMLFVFGLSSEISQKNLIIYGMAFPFIISASVIIMILDDQKLSKTIAFTSVSIGLLGIVIGVVFIDVIMLDNYISHNITVKSFTKFYENLNSSKKLL